jgi:PHD/YefM family antitoxin component YafN of YafNO toxin-antitoxin module
MKIVFEKDVVSLTDFARRTRKHTADLKRHNRPRVLTCNGKAAAVVLSVSAFDQLMHEAEEHRLEVRLQGAIDAYARGERGAPLDQAFQQIRVRVRQRRSAK